MKCGDQFWLSSTKNIICDYRLIPTGGMSLEAQMNAATRLVLLISIILLLIRNKYTGHFLLVSLLLIALVYFLRDYQTISHSDSDHLEYYTNLSGSPLSINTPNIDIGYGIGGPGNYTENKKFNFTNSRRFCRDGKVLEPNETYQSQNQKLVGCPNAKTLVAPVLAPPIYGLETWAENSFIVPSHINTQTHTDDYLSGYYSTPDACNSLNQREIKEDYFDTRRPQLKTNETTTEQKWKPFDSFTTPLLFDAECHLSDERTYDDLYGIDTATGYYPYNKKYNIPVNTPVPGTCNQTSEISDYNKELDTMYFDSGLKFRSEVMEPINHNMGISLTEQIPPIRCTKDTVIQLDPIMNREIRESSYRNDEAMHSNVYDPRITGYGDNNRYYYDNEIGQPRYFYDDVEAIRKPNYYARSKIDFMTDNSNYVKTQDTLFNTNYRYMADKAYTDNTLTHRSNLQESLMRKRNTEMRQLREAPLSINGFGMK